MISKNIFFIIPDLRCGGAEKVFINLANFYSKDHDITFLVLKKKGEMINLLDKKVKIVSLDVDRIRNSLPKLIKIFRNINHSLIISAMWPLNSIVMIASLFSSRTNKYFLTEHVNLSHSIGIDFKSNKFLILISISLTYFLSKKIICVSNGVKKDIEKYYIFNKNKIHTIYNPLISHKNSYTKKNNTKIQLLSVGTLKDQKDHKTLLKAFSLLDDYNSYHLNIVGDGNLKKDLIEMSIDLKINNHVTFHGYKENVDFYYKTCDIFILSSLYEGFGNVLVEALAYGMQIISTNCNSGPSEILDNGKYGILVPINDPYRMSLSINKILLKRFDPKLLMSRSEDFQISKIANNYLNLMLKS